ncbi:MAG: M15 family metallopeptidase [bacterium]|nr:M15 family metallopeptidase [bacterium]
MWWFKKLISRSPTYKELQRISAGESKEELIDVRTYNKQIIAHYEDSDMRPYLGDFIFVREKVAKKLGEVQQFLSERYGYNLCIIDGYRHPDVQKSYFEERRAILSQSNPNLTPTELDQATHIFIAVPSIAGHPTGGAVDLTLMNKNGSPLDMGMRVADFNNAKKMATFAGGLTNRQKKNRKILLDAMIKMDFAPFYGEWWHFSYGDREWAWQKRKKQAIYGPTDLKIK